MTSRQKQQSQALKQVEVIYTTLSGLAMMCVILTAGLLLPVFGFNGLSSPFVAGTILITVAIGVGALYRLNLQAHKVVLDQARLTDVLINSLGQGFLTFDAKGVCGPVYSQACLSLLQTDQVPGSRIADVLHIPQGQNKEFQDWLDILFMPGHALSFDDAVRFLPDTVNRDDGHSVDLHYRPVRDKEGRLTRIVLIATDRTEEKEAQKRADQERQFAAMICAIFAERQSFILTMQQAGIILDQLRRFDGDNLFSIDFFREVHTIKGAALHFKMEGLGTALHNLEQTLRDAKSLSRENAREEIDHVRAEVQLEFGRIQNSLRDLLGTDDARPQGLIEIDEESAYAFGRLLKQNVSADIYYAYQSSILSVPLFTLLKSLDRQMLPLAEKLEKRVKPIKFSGDAVRVPSRPMQHLVLSLTHVVHNIIDHGIETPITRMAKGKDAAGEVMVHVRRMSDDNGQKWIEIAIKDDGAGIDPNRVRQKLGDTDPTGEWRFEDDEAIVQRLLTQDISTRDETTLLSGRGAGMSAVYQEVVRLGGRAILKSEVHKGTQLLMYLPDTLETGPA